MPELLTPEAVTAAVKAVVAEDEYADDYDGESLIWDWLEEATWNDHEVETSVGNIKRVESVGGEGQGDHQHLVIQTIATGQYFRVDGWYTSYDGGEYDGDLYEVQKVERLVTFYEKENHNA